MNKLTQLRDVMNKNKIDYVIIPSSDYHQSEYVAEYFKGREYISGFTGSAGTLLVGMDEAMLWTDGRYFIQAEKELNNSGIDLMKMRTPGYPTLEEWIKDKIKEGEVLAFDGKVISANQYKDYLKISKENGFKIEIKKDLINGIWIDRPELSKKKVFLHDIEFCGKSAKEKLNEVRENLRKKKAENYVLSSLDDIAWLCNIRGNDIKFNPVVMSYMIITKENTKLYIDKDKVSKDIEEKLLNEGIELRDYENIIEDVATLEGKTIVDPSKINASIYSQLKGKVIEELNVTTKLKAIKNDVEIKNINKSQVRDGIAMIKFIKWLKENVGKEKITEISASKKLTTLRELGENYKGDSFGTIAGYKDHAAMMHYSATEETQYDLEPKGMFLVDSGGQYLDGTTDITRTFILGDITYEEKRDFTLVLKGNISLTMAKFLKGTVGANLDVLARRPLWEYGIDYKCGTGHGIGFFLNVHEGPHGIRPELNPVALEPGMLVTNEPGVYKQGKYGIRTENVLLVVKDIKTEESGEFYRFEPVTYCPIDLEGIDDTLLDEKEKQWLNEYHKLVFEKLSPYLDQEEREFLQKQTRAI